MINSYMTQRKVCATNHVLSIIPEPAIVRKNSNPTTESIIYAVGRVTGLTLDDLVGPSRKRPIVEARQMLMTLLYTKTGISLTEIGKMFNRHHSTVIYAKSNVFDLLLTDKSFKMKYESILDKI